MIKKCLLTTSLLLPLVAISGAALAGPGISDRRYFPNEARSQQPASPFAMEPRTFIGPTAPPAFGSGQRVPASKPHMYIGGPKSGLTR
jgi:hypothetical protein